jgi:hypothetical protein
MLPQQQPPNGALPWDHVAAGHTSPDRSVVLSVGAASATPPCRGLGGRTGGTTGTIDVLGPSKSGFGACLFV